MLCYDSEEKLFSKSVPISIRNECTNQSRPCHLCVTIEWQEQDASAALYSHKVLSIILTDEKDPFFLYTLNLSWVDFQVLKTNQDLKIDFVEFPQNIIALINKCLDEEKSSDPKFLLVFTINENFGNGASSPKLDIIESKQLKYLTHLSLKFIRATDSAVKQNIITYTSKIKETNKGLLNKCTYLEEELRSQLMAYQQTLNRKDQDFKSMKNELDDKLSMKERKHAEKLKEEQDRLHNYNDHLQRLKEQESRYEREKREKDNNHQKEIQALKSECKALDGLNKDLQVKHSKFESVIRDLKSKVISLEDYAKILKDNAQSYKEKCHSMYSEVQSKQSQIRHLDSKINVLKTEIQTKDRSIELLREEIEKQEELKKKQEDKLSLAKRQYDASEKSVKSLGRDRQDLNSVVLDLQDIIKKLKFKIDNDAKYEFMLEEKEKMLQNVKTETLKLNCLLESKTAEIKSLNDEGNCLNDEMAKLKENIRGQDNGKFVS